MPAGFIAQTSLYGILAAFHKLILIALQLTNQIKQKFPTKSCSARVIFKIALGRGLIFDFVNFPQKNTPWMKTMTSYQQGIQTFKNLVYSL